MSIKVMPAVNDKGNYLVSLNFIKAGKAFHKISEYEIILFPTRTSIQINKHESIEESSHIAHMNHSCDPNVLIDISQMELRAIRDIEPGEELNFFYPSTEWDISTPFQCLCGFSHCLKKIAGAKYLSPNVLSRYFINQHIWKELETYSNTSFSDDFEQLSNLGSFPKKNILESTANSTSFSNKKVIKL
jgi:hypothetical protein